MDYIPGSDDVQQKVVDVRCKRMERPTPVQEPVRNDGLLVNLPHPLEVA